MAGVDWRAVAESGDWAVEFYAYDSGREPCRAWMERLTPQKRIALEEAIRLVLVRRGLAVVETEFGKALGGGLYEFRLRWSAAEVQRKVGGVTAGTPAKAEKIMLRVFLLHLGPQDHLVAERLRQGEGSGRAAPGQGDRPCAQAPHGP
ncbi:MAG: hypothetical protein M3Y33_00945 [Actinomycetota bacterium]|nr:hypothetical protein [Actinomycetota bacterium]